jgi:hypothetical protein
MNTQELAQKTADLMDLSVAEVHKLIEQMDVDQIINLTAAVQDADADTIQEILDAVSMEPTESEVDTMPEIKTQLQREGRKLLKAEEDLTALWPLIGKLTAEEWKMVWPSLDEEILKALYQEATQKTTDNISANDAQMLHDYSISFIAESMVIYENEWWQVTIPQAPDNLVGISQSDHMIWVPRHQLQPLTEHVMGMTQMPSIARMQALAGINTESDHKPHMHVMATLPPKPLQSDLGWLHELRMHIKEIEQLVESPDSPDHQEEMQLHMQALSRKARNAAQKIKGT